MKIVVFSLCLIILQVVRASVKQVGFQSYPNWEKQCGVNKCRADQKCIDVVSEECTQATCTRFPTCVPIEAQECHIDFCPQGKVCLNKEPSCPHGNQKCSIVKTCVSSYSEQLISDQCNFHSCSNGYKCIEIVTPDCEDARCTKYPVCVQQEASSCTSTTCSTKEVCVNVQEECYNQPCPITKKCLSEKPIQTCGVENCRGGEDCYELAASDCRVHNCPKYPTCLKPQDLPCNKVDCGGNSVCVNIRTQCPYTACDIYARCVPKVAFPPTTPIREEISCSATSCKPGQKCIDTVSPTCKDNGCTRFPSCVPEVARACTIHECGRHQVCVNVQEECKTQPCPVTKKCLPYAYNDNACGDHSCRSNEVCIRGFQCNVRGCNAVYVCIPRNGESCDGVHCIRGTSCFMIKESTCTGPECYAVPQCLFSNQNKEGRCPAPRPGVGGICIEQCSSDAECSLNLKCCSNGCGHVCTTPDLGLAKYDEKEGRCPAGRVDGVGICLHECSSDADCSYNFKCCSNGCGSICTRPELGHVQQPNYEEKEGQCPVVPPGGAGACVQECAFDAECLHDLKCCSNGCGTTCTRPVGGQLHRPSNGEQCGSTVCQHGEACYSMAAGDCQYSGCSHQSVCLKQQEMPCNTVDCSPSSVCVNVRTDCPYTACDIYARCVPNQQSHPSGVSSPQHSGVVCGATKCEAGLKCIEAVPPECVDASCTKFPLCVPDVARPCTENECGPNEQCVNVQEKCSSQPCPVSKKCVPYKACSASHCRRNEMCISAQQCDERGCQETTACIPENAPTCAGARCRRNTECFMVVPYNCQGSRCHPIPQCLFTGGNTEKCGDLPCNSNEQCELVYQCTEPSCNAYKTCLPKNVRTCADTSCGNCRMVQIRHCITQPCHPEPYCEEVSECQSKSCNLLESCIIALECSTSGCKEVEACISPHLPTCADHHCSSRTECAMVTDPQCYYGTCYPVPQCLPKVDKLEESVPGSSSGQCPRLPYNPLASSCVNDQSCQPGQKCCRFEGSTRRTCTPATYVSEEERPGQCPSEYFHRQSSCEEQYQSLVCSGDGECPLNYKCCYNGCVKVCTAPYSVKG